MSKVCTKAVGITKRARVEHRELCGRPAMTRYKGEWICWTCRERLEEQDKERSGDKNSPRR